MSDLAMPSTLPVDDRRRRADRIFQAAVVFNIALTLFWLSALWGGPTGGFFNGYRVDRAAIIRVSTGILFFYVYWGFIWWAVKNVLLRKFVGFTPDERREAFSSRMRRPFEVADYTARYSERRIRITDMIGRRGRFITLAAGSVYYLYVQISRDHNPNFATAFLQDNLFDAVVTSWVFLAFYYADGWLAGVFYGPQSRVMDGVLARANCLLITTLWTVFKFAMVPIGTRLAQVFPKQEFAAIFVMIWGAYIAADASAEIFGALFGSQRIAVWGVGDVNRKSVTGIVAAFVSALVLCAGVVFARGLGPSWYTLAVVLAASNTLLELYSPRGTDDCTMATANALICLGFGLWFR